ncbi:hypothetical protein Pyrde_0741 [Pyrodictium delaneyi]|uniref:Uncharacterized protein n=2 Tax=Pyrodictium delaneyi TaxID=1273541 RepID=A0A0P0N361_9CREN|nr:zinc ribbon domain-containing protein [Pyrodictium delaneyi]ALL00791.1 hypothetical protein Pyrde_0741 [Pyrodictium delaneyi]
MSRWLEVFEGRWKCPKCGSMEIIVNEHAFTGTGLSRLLDWQSYEYVAVTCKKCGYTEFYNKAILGDERNAVKILDLIFGS